ncbi:MAG: GIY-YIG nuclease family protein [Anaerolineales bacterium]|nr:GIY-YIG nuclease family protein [Anaerolineales bacterium]
MRRERVINSEKNDLENLPAEKGTYILILSSEGQDSFWVGKLGLMVMQTGVYYYVGSARGPGGLKARLRRHLQKSKAPHWHIDYLRQRSEILEIWFSQDPRQLEHRTAGLLAEMKGFLQPQPGFGASDCSCPTHLFFSDQQAEIQEFQALFRTWTGLEVSWNRYK